MSRAVLDTPLDGLGLIEASAGTGKTYTLAGLFARAVIVLGHAVPEVLAVTFTDRATQELHERVRDRLQRAAELAAHWRDGDPPQRDGDDPGTALLRGLIHAALAGGTQSLPVLRRRLARAARDIDQAAIVTIHGFCQRMLAEHALDTGQVLLAAELVGNVREAHEAIAVELWREWNGDEADCAWLRTEYRDPGGLADALPALLSSEPLLPLAPASVDTDAAWTRLRQAWSEVGRQAMAAIEVATAGRILSKAKDKFVPVEMLRDWLDAQSAPRARVPDELIRLTPGYLRSICGKNKEGDCPQSPLFDAVADYLRAREAVDLVRLHRLRDQAGQRDRARKQAFQQRGFDDLIEAMLDAVEDEVQGPRLCAAVRAQFPVALIDEFQDTDARQWTIFARLFGDQAPGGLLLVGDPKQAIYRFRGGDVHTYQRARAAAAVAPPLADNFRSRPWLIDAVNALFQQPHLHGRDVLGADIAFTATQPGGTVDDQALRLGDAPAPALVFNELPASPSGKPWSKDAAVEHCARGCAQAIRDLLADGGTMQREEGGTRRALLPRDCAVLVRTHDEAVAVRHALALLGVPAVATGRQSLFETEQAQELLTLLLALAAPGDERRLRAALGTRLFGFDAARLATLAQDGDALQAWQHHFAAWRLRWEQHGPQAMLTEVVARNAGRLLAQIDGERQLTFLLHLGELLQEARATATQPRGLGPQGQIDWLRAAIANADRNDVQQQPRLESDAGRVQILTLHACKGLEFPLVFLPFVAIGRQRKAPDFAQFQWQGERVRQVRTQWRHGDEPAWDEAWQQHEAEERGEDMRLLYVGLTRAREAVWLWSGAMWCQERTALHTLLGGARPNDALRDRLGAALALPDARVPDRADTARLPTAVVAQVPPPRPALRTLRRDWWIHSFSQLHRLQPHGAQALIEESPATDERPVAATAVQALASLFDSVDPRFRGERFGNAVHHALEHADFAAWRDADAVPPAGEREGLVRALESQDYAADAIDDGVVELTRLVAATLNAPLPEGGRLCDLPATARVAEIEFHFTLADADSAALLALLHEHGVASSRRDFGHWLRLSGLMTGKIDLTYVADGRVFVLDYKSNLLPDYEPATLEATMRGSEYDLQALLYVVALHRWLRVRRGAAYDHARDFGGVRYLFCRGLARDSARGICAPVFPTALVAAVDALLGQGAAA